MSLPVYVCVTRRELPFDSSTSRNAGSWLERSVYMFTERCSGQSMRAVAINECMPSVNLQVTLGSARKESSCVVCELRFDGDSYHI